MPTVIGRDGRTHLTTFEDSSVAICGEITAEASARAGDLAVNHDQCLIITSRRTEEN